MEVPLDANADAVLIAREGKTRDALGFPVGARRIGHHVLDGFENAEYDEVTELDSAGNVQSVTQFDSKGRLLRRRSRRPRTGAGPPADAGRRR